ncbi:MAG: NUDIX domain-containing protein [Gemmatimonadaceae bacterium]|nr:NUDIX domain-containing protein [Gemmatimonadaceae bacterium]MCW5825889.1 NUDIX domain-containing protein [Gemmatimonadaceae bacterium]
MTRKKKPREEVSAGGIVFRRDGERTFYLLIRDPYRNWGFPKGHLEAGEEPAAAALREVAEETGIGDVAIHSAVETIDWTFRFRGRKIHKTCHFFLMETSQRRTAPQSAEGITACRWATYDQATKMIAYDNARAVLELAHAMLQDAEASSVASAARAS